MNKYILFEPSYAGLTNIIMMLETAASISHITNRTLVLPPKFFVDHLSQKPAQKNFFTNIFDIFDINKIKSTFNCIDYIDVPEFKDKIDLISCNNYWFSNLKKHVDDVYSVNFNSKFLNDTNQFLTYEKKNTKDFFMFSSFGNRKYVELNVPNKFLFFDKNLFSYYWYRIYDESPKKRNELKRKINTCFDYHLKFYDKSKKVLDLIGEYNSIHVRRGDFLTARKNQIDCIDSPEKLLHVVEYLIPNNLPLYIATDEKDLNFFEPITKKYKTYFYNDFNLSDSNLESIILEQLICYNSNLFYGTKFSTYSKRINFLRAWHKNKINDNIFLDDFYSVTDYSNPLPWVDKLVNYDYNIYGWVKSSHPQWTFELE